MTVLKPSGMNAKSIFINKTCKITVHSIKSKTLLQLQRETFLSLVLRWCFLVILMIKFVVVITTHAQACDSKRRVWKWHPCFWFNMSQTLQSNKLINLTSEMPTNKSLHTAFKTQNLTNIRIYIFIHTYIHICICMNIYIYMVS